MADCFVTRSMPGGAEQRIIQAGYSVEVWPERTPPPAQVLKEKTTDSLGLICMLTDPIDSDLLASASKLKVVSQMAVGCDNIDLDACKAKGIPVGNTPGVLTDATADLTMALILSLARRLPEGGESVHSGRWITWEPDFLLGMELRDRTLGIIGSGRIGTAVAERAKSFGMKVISTGRPESENSGLPLEQLLTTSDIVSLHCPLTEQTRGLVNDEFLAMMQPHALLINTSRGPVVNQVSLATALRNGVIAGAALDVTDPEPLPATDPLLESPNLIVIPHLGSATHRTREAMANIAVDNLLAGLAGEPLPHRIA